MMQTAANSNEYLRYKLTHYEQEAQELRRHFTHTEHQIIDQHRHEAHNFAQAQHDEVQRKKLHASTEQAAATTSSHALQATRAQLKNSHAECNTIRGQLTDAESRYASAAASETTGDTAKIIRGPWSP